LRVQKLREQVAKKERDKNFNVIPPVIPSMQESRVKEKANTPTLTSSDDDMDLLYDDESPLIKDESPPPIGMDINMLFTMPAKFRGTEEDVAQMCLSPKEARFEKPEESTPLQNASVATGDGGLTL
jgi:hypothetical protein